MESRRRGRSLVPQMVGRYEILLPIGSGGMATVYLARVRGIGGFERDAALKLLHPNVNEALDGDPLEEAKLAARLRHPNAVPVLDVGEDPAGIYLVMEYIEGDSLSGLCVSAAKSSGEPVPAPIALRILSDALAGLHAMHELTNDKGALLGIVHRDFTPHNILVGVDGVTRLTDFGIAKVTSQTGATAPGLVKGKIRYMAPEQARGAPVDRRADVWSAGVVAWELFAGKRLYAAAEDAVVLLQLVAERPRDLRSERPDLPPALTDAVSRALATDPATRYPSVESFRRDLADAWRSSGPIAEAAEVGAFVRLLSSAKLDKRRAKIDEVLLLRAETGRVSELPSLPRESQVEVLDLAKPQSARSSQASLPGANLEQDEQPTRVERFARWKLGGRWIAVSALVGVAFIASLFGLLGSRSTDAVPGASPPTVASGAATAPTGASTVGALVAPLETVAAADAPRGRDMGVRVTSDTPMARVRLGQRTFVIAPPAREVVVTTTPTERDGALELEVVAADGRRSLAAIPPGESAANVAFSGTPPPTRAKARPPGTEASDGPGPLVPNPYNTKKRP